MWIYEILAFLLVFLAAMSILMFRKAFRRPKSVDMSKDEELNCSALFGYAPIIKPAIQWMKSLKTENMTVTAADGIQLHGEWIPGKAGAPVILLLHGYASDPWNDFCLTARWAIRRGYSVLLPEGRGCGQSEGKYTTLGVLESGDCCSWVEALREKLGEDCRLILLGMGAGGTAAMLALNRGLPKNVKAIATEGAYTSVREQILYTIKNRYHMRSFPLLQLFTLYAMILWKHRIGTENADEALKHNTEIPMFFAAGKADLVVPHAETEKAYDCCAAPKRMFLSENAGHAACGLAETERYYTELQDFLKETLK